MSTIMKYNINRLTISRYFECDDDISKGIIFQKIAKELIGYGIWHVTKYWDNFDIASAIHPLVPEAILEAKSIHNKDKALFVIGYLTGLLSRYSAPDCDEETELALNEALITFFETAERTTEMEISYIELESKF